MSSVKRACCNAMASYLRTQFPGMKVVTPQAPYTQDMEYPSIAVVPRAFNFIEPMQEDEVEDEQPYTLLVNVGDFEGQVEVRVAANSAFEREEIEQRVIELMLGTEFAPGYLGLQTEPVNLGGVQYQFQALATFELGQEQWHEEMVFSNERYSYLTLDTTFPALVSRGSVQDPVYTIETLVLAINHDLASDAAEEQRQVHEDGSITVYP